ncbi:MAG: hypothetical protein ACI8ZB_005061 [Desulforhopalus sp.]|jgi:hypothetical protein
MNISGVSGENNIFNSNPGKRKTSRDSVQYPLEGYKCMGARFKLLMLNNTLYFLVFYDRFSGVRH